MQVGVQREIDRKGNAVHQADGPYCNLPHIVQCGLGNQLSGGEGGPNVEGRGDDQRHGREADLGHKGDGLRGTGKEPVAVDSEGYQLDNGDCSCEG